MIELLLLVLGVYLLIGVAFAIPFVILGVKRIDPGAIKGTRGFRLMIVPGCVLFWPYLLRRWIRNEGPPVEHSPHREAAKG